MSVWLPAFMARINRAGNNASFWHSGVSRTTSTVPGAAVVAPPTPAAAAVVEGLLRRVLLPTEAVSRVSYEGTRDRGKGATRFFAAGAAATPSAAVPAAVEEAARPRREPDNLLLPAVEMDPAPSSSPISLIFAIASKSGSTASASNIPHKKSQKSASVRSNGPSKEKPSSSESIAAAAAAAVGEEEEEEAAGGGGGGGAAAPLLLFIVLSIEGRAWLWGMVQVSGHGGSDPGGGQNYPGQSNGSGTHRTDKCAARTRAFGLKQAEKQWDNGHSRKVRSATTASGHFEFDMPASFRVYHHPTQQLLQSPSSLEFLSVSTHR